MCLKSMEIPSAFSPKQSSESKNYILLLNLFLHAEWPDFWLYHQSWNTLYISSAHKAYKPAKYINDSHGTLYNEKQYRKRFV